MPIAGQIKIVHKEPPEDVIWREVGDISTIEPLFQKVLVANYLRPEGKTAGGIAIPYTVLDEDRFQAKVGLVLKVGPRAFQDEPNGPYPVLFHGFKVGAGDWVVYRPSEGLKLQIGQRECRLISDVHLQMRIQDPDDVF